MVISHLHVNLECMFMEIISEKFIENLYSKKPKKYEEIISLHLINFSQKWIK